jgi:hypothetical protein
MTTVELINAIKDMHTGPHGAPCPECVGQTVPCRTYAYVDGILAERFQD